MLIYAHTDKNPFVFIKLNLPGLILVHYEQDGEMEGFWKQTEKHISLKSSSKHKLGKSSSFLKKENRSSMCSNEAMVRKLSTR